MNIDLSSFYRTELTARKQKLQAIVSRGPESRLSGLVREEGVRHIESTSTPLGLFCDGQFEVETVRLEPGNTLVLSSDGITEARQASGEEFGVERLAAAARAGGALPARSLVETCRSRLEEFLAGERAQDDRTLLAARFSPGN